MDNKKFLEFFMSNFDYMDIPNKPSEDYKKGFTKACDIIVKAIETGVLFSEITKNG